MRTRLIYTILIATLVTSVSAQQQQLYKGEIYVIPKQLEQRGDSLYLNLELNLRGVTIDSRQSVNFTPLLISSAYGKSFPSILIKGGSSYRDYWREMTLINKRDRAEYIVPYSVVKSLKVDNRTLIYSYTVAYEPWMGKAKLYLRKDVDKCREDYFTVTEPLVQNVVLEKTLVVEP